ncbi:MAG: SgcJ/EcaC family oxidoreductase [Chlamydiota bacterium]|nr:SgcJ/EcaC family oxidoreductase [Chlamydiota bacterium]
MKKICLAAIFSFLFLHNAFTTEPEDEIAIGNILEDWSYAWNHQAGSGIGEHYSEHADFINIFGMHFKSKEEIEQRHIHILKTFLKDSLFEMTNIHLREISPNLIIGHVSWKVNGFHAAGQELSASGEIRQGIFTHVFVKNSDNKWEIVASHNTLCKN